jgi:hypothetical protein
MEVKRTLEEICSIYSLEPQLKDIFVEGRSDKIFVDWYLQDSNADDVSVYTIDSIDITEDIVTEHNLTKGSKRSCVLALACTLAVQFPHGLNVLCLADRDFEDYLATVEINRYILFTDCNSLDLYSFSMNSMQKFTMVALGGLPVSADVLMNMLDAVLRRVYLLRLVNELLGWKMEWVSFSRYVSVNRCSVSFDENKFTRAYLQKNGRWADRNEFNEHVLKSERLLSSERGRRIRGHDLSELLLSVIRTMKRDRKYGNRETLEGSLMATIERRDLEATPCFQRIHDLCHHSQQSNIGDDSI